MSREMKKILSNEANIEKFAKECLDLENKKNKEINEMLADTKYIYWLIDFLDTYPSFNDDDWVYFPEELSKKDKLNIKKLKLLYEIIDKYCISNCFYPYITDYGNYYRIKYNNISFIIGVSIGQGCYFYCKKLNNLDNCIDFDNILNNIDRENIESIKIDLKKLSDQIKLLYEYGIPTLAIKECVDNTLNEIEENKTLRKTINSKSFLIE